jgi:hypothetical protein
VLGTVTGSGGTGTGGTGGTGAGGTWTGGGGGSWGGGGRSGSVGTVIVGIVGSWASPAPADANQLPRRPAASSESHAASRMKGPTT